MLFIIISMGATAKGVAVFASIAATAYFSRNKVEDTIPTKIAADKIVVTSDGSVFLRNNKKKLGFLAGLVIIGTVLYVVFKKKRQSRIRNQDEEITMQIQKESHISSQYLESQIEKYTCPITNELMNVPYSLKCGHEFEKDRIQEALKRDPRCPLCRRVMNFTEGIEVVNSKEMIKELNKRIRQQQQKMEKLATYERLAERI